jgi:hypothetical protein
MGRQKIRLAGWLAGWLTGNRTDWVASGRVSLLALAACQRWVALLLCTLYCAFGSGIVLRKLDCGLSTNLPSQVYCVSPIAPHYPSTTTTTISFDADADTHDIQ